jgi:hypothetical protein
VFECTLDTVIQSGFGHASEYSDKTFAGEARRRLLVETGFDPVELITVTAVRVTAVARQPHYRAQSHCESKFLISKELKSKTIK